MQHGILDSICLKACSGQYERTRHFGNRWLGWIACVQHRWLNPVVAVHQAWSGQVTLRFLDGLQDRAAGWFRCVAIDCSNQWAVSDFATRSTF